MTSKSKNFYKSGFDEPTMEKLNIYKSYVEGWLPVFLSKSWERERDILFFDFFSGPGEDVNGKKGSPIILLEQLIQQSDSIKQQGKSIRIFFNDSNKEHIDKLKKVCEKHKLHDYDLDIEISCTHESFNDAFEKRRELLKKLCPKLIFLGDCQVFRVS